MPLRCQVEALPEDEAKYHLKRCEDSGLWVPSSEAGALGEAIRWTQHQDGVLDPSLLSGGHPPFQALIRHLTAVNPNNA